MLREDTVANEFKAWVVNRTDSTMILKAIPATEKKVQEKIERRRKAYVRWLKD